MEQFTRCKYNFDEVMIDEYWNFGNEKADKIHQIHSYPAKFPSFITTKAIDYAEKKNIQVKKIGDIFCGCGTVAYESLKKDLDFWGCDVNPVASLIARVKSRKLDPQKLTMYFDKIVELSDALLDRDLNDNINPRIYYWFEIDRIIELQKILFSIKNICSNDIEYKEFFYVVFLTS